MPKKSIIAVLCAVMMTIIASVALVLAVAPHVHAADDVFVIPEDYFLIYQTEKKLVGFKEDKKSYVKYLDKFRIEVPDGIRTISSNAFFNYSGLVSVKIPDSVTEIKEGVFANCQQLCEVEIGSGLAILGDQVFQNTPALTEIVIPKSVQSMGDYVLRGKKTVYCEVASKPDGWSELWVDDTDPDINVVWGYDPNNNPSITANHDVTFDSNGGSVVAEPVVTVAEGETVTKPTDPTKDHYNFAGWYLNNTQYDFTTPVTDDITLVAHWTPKQYKVQFHTNGGNDIADQMVNYNETVNVADPIRTGWNFMGWYTDAEMHNSFSKSTPITGPLELYAEWSQSQCLVTFDTTGGNTINGESVVYNGTVTRPADPTKDGYTFEGWYLGGELYDFDTPITTNITLQARWTANQTQPEDPTNPDDPNNQNGGNENNEEHNETITSATPKKNNIGMIAGIIIAAVVGLAAIIAGVATFVLKQRKKL